MVISPQTPQSFSQDVDLATASSLPELPPLFFVPRLEDKPQNPIMDTLRLFHHRTHALPLSEHPIPQLLPQELEVLSEELFTLSQENKRGSTAIWELAALRKHGYMNQALSWDSLRSSFNTNPAPSPLLSEQSSNSFASARYHLRPPLQYPDVKLVYVKIPDLFQSLVLTVCGTSSPLHIWDSSSQRFTLANLQGKKHGQIVIVSKDEVVSASLLKRFLSIGNLMRRLELLTDSLGPSHTTPILHAFTHALSSILTYLRESAEMIPPDLQVIPGADLRLVALWTRYEDMESILQALSALCGREEHADPPDYTELPSTPTALLSAIYSHLADHIERSSPRIVTAMLAFMLTTTSRGYIQTLCASVGYNTPSSHNRSPLLNGRMPPDDAGRLGAGLENDTDNGHVHLRDDEQLSAADEFPQFITADVAETFSRARRSLVLLRAADAEHPLLTSKYLHPEIEWLWTEEQLESMQDGVPFGGPQIVRSPEGQAGEDKGPSPTLSDADVMRAFKIFDLLPGDPDPDPEPTARTGAPTLFSNSHTTSTLRTFLASFPPSLPSSTPTLAHLTARVLAPLVTHAQALSGALVARFLSPTTHFHLHTHLVLLRGHILITAHSFKARLQDALFADAEDLSKPVVGSRIYAASEARERTKSRSKSRSRAASGAAKGADDEMGKKTQTRGKTGRRAVGLSPALTIGDKWPPLGSDLNFLLRTVVVDALEEEHVISRDRDEDGVDDERQRAQERIAREAEWRVGFAIRDLPMGTGREKWLNPLSIEALDFLYMHYQPPYPLDVLITPAILSKYHRMFAFNLRLMRVETVVRTLFRLTRRAAAPLFPTLTPSNKLLLHFRFVAHSFVMALSSYVYDVAIGSNMDAFLARLAVASNSIPSQTPSLSRGGSVFADRGHRAAGEGGRGEFADVFSLAEHHSNVLDDVLSSCLLRSGQKAVGDILRGCMELVLELGVLAGELRDGNLEEYEAAPMLEDLWGRFRAKMSTLVKVLKALVEKEADIAGLVLSDIPLHMMQGHQRVSGTTANLHQLLLRLDMSDWWVRKGSTRPAE